MATFEFPGSVTVSPPQVPELVMAPPPFGATTLVMPTPGPVGPQGPPGDSTEVLGYRHIQSQPALLVQVNHGLPYRPAGIICTENDGYQLEYDTVAHPQAGLTELTFGVLFVGTIDFS